MHDRLNQLVLGTYVGTFLYCLLVLSTVKSQAEMVFVPQWSILFAIGLAVANIFLLILFIHHISVSIQADKVISDLSNSIWKSIRTAFPEQAAGTPATAPSRDWEARYTHSTPILAPKNGYIQLIDQEALLHLARQHDGLIKLTYRAGEFLVEGSTLGYWYHLEAEDAERAQTIANKVILGQIRTSLQDVEFAVHQLVEIAAKALSPGVNDPYTAIACIDYLTATLCHLTKVDFPTGYRCDEEETLRLITKPYDFAGIMDAAFFQIRQFATGSPAVLIRLMKALATIGSFARDGVQLAAVQRHADMVLRAGQSALAEKHDLEDLVERYDAVPKAVGEG
jgi:uncharacterized membrane protein